MFQISDPFGARRLIQLTTLVKQSGQCLIPIELLNNFMNLFSNLAYTKLAVPMLCSLFTFEQCSFLRQNCSLGPGCFRLNLLSYWPIFYFTILTHVHICYLSVLRAKLVFSFAPDFFHSCPSIIQSSNLEYCSHACV